MIPAHKQTDMTKKPGQWVNNELRTNTRDSYPPQYVVNPLGFTIQPSEKTLAEYIARKTRDNAFKTVKAENKMTFEEWWNTKSEIDMALDNPESFKYLFERAWNAGQKNV